MPSADESALPVDQSTMLSPQIRVTLQVLLIVGGVAFALWLLHELAAVVFVLILAALFAYVIAPLVRLAESHVRVRGRRRRLSRGLAIAVVYLGIAGSAAAATVLLLPSATEQVADMIASAPAYTQSILTWEHGWSRYYERLRMPLEAASGHRPIGRWRRTPRRSPLRAGCSSSR